jgi:hypothetical protein
MDPILIALAVGIVIFACVYAFVAGQGQRVGLFGLIVCSALFVLLILIRVLTGASIVG